ncbi:MAG: hypothetical protein ACFB51_02885 [Anaerolineae bacterium]
MTSPTRTAAPALTRQLTVARLLTFLTLAGVVLIAVRPPLDSDMFWHLRAGQWQWENASLLRVDPFAHTASTAETWINHGAPVQVGMYGLYAYLGNFGLILYVVACALGGMAFVLAVTPGGPFTRFLAIILTTLAAQSLWVARPLMISIILSGLLYFWLRRWQQGALPHLWIAVPLMIAWVNLHGTGVSGFILLVLATLGEGAHWLFTAAAPALRERSTVPFPKRTAHLTAVGLLSAAGGALLNPYGVDFLYYPFFTVNMEAARALINEWAAPALSDPKTWPFFLLLALLPALMGATRERLTWQNAVLVGLSAAAALTRARLIPTFALIAAPVLALHLDPLVERLGVNWERPVRHPAEGLINTAIVLVVLGVLGLHTTSALRSRPLLQAEHFPVDAARALRTQAPPPLLFNGYNWGGYLMWAAPDYQVYIDGRADLHGDRLIFRSLHIEDAGEGWQQMLAEDGINTVLVAGDTGLAAALQNEPGWEPLYSDEQAVVYTRTVPLE